MTRDQALAWARAQYGPAARGVLREVGAQTAALAGSGGPFLIDYFEAALNSADMFGRIKLVHVAGLLENATREKKKAAALHRRKALEGIFLRHPRFDLPALRRMYDAAFSAACEDFFPVASVEWDVRAGTFEEVSLYCDQDAPRLAAALSSGTAPDLAGLYAVGYDFRPGKPSRFKLYYRRNAGLRARKSGRPFLALPTGGLPRDYLILRRRPDGGRFEEAKKVYLCYLSPEAVRLDCRISVLARRCAPGPLKDFLSELLPSASDQWLDYIGCEGGRFEAYLARPAWRAGLKRSPPKGGRLWVLP